MPRRKFAFFAATSIMPQSYRIQQNNDEVTPLDAPDVVDIDRRVGEEKIRYTVTTYPRTARPVMTATRARTVPSKFSFCKGASRRMIVSTKYVQVGSGTSCHPKMPISSGHSRSPHTVTDVHAASGKWRGCSHMYASFHSGSNCSRGWVSAWARRHTAMSADTATTHSGDKMKLGTTMSARLLHHRRSPVIRHTTNSNTTNTICGCLLNAQRVIHSERSQTRPYRWTALKQRAVITNA